MILTIRFRPVRQQPQERATEIVSTAPDFHSAYLEFADRFARLFPTGDIIAIQQAPIFREVRS